MENKKFEELNEQELTNVSGGGIVLGKEDLATAGARPYLYGEKAAKAYRGHVIGRLGEDDCANAKVIPIDKPIRNRIDIDNIQYLDPANIEYLEK